MDHPLKRLREASGFSQMEICRRTAISATRLSMAENSLTELTASEEESIKASIVAATKGRADVVVAEADPRFITAMRTIEKRPSAKKLFTTLKESGYSAVESAVFVLGRDYPK